MGIKIPKKLKAIPRRTLYISAAFLILLGGFAWWRPGRAHAQTDTFTTSGTWTVPSGVASAVFEAWGGGGAGGGATTSNAGGGGGAGGQYAKTTLSGLSTGTNYTATVATTTAGTTGNGSAGSDSGVVSPSSTQVVLAKGGAGGLASANGGTGGTGSTTSGVGDTVYPGGSGGIYGIGAGGGGGGGAGSTGAGGDGGIGTIVTAGTGTSTNGGNGGTGGTNAAGSSGNNYGGGGGGAGRTNGGSKSGGAGAPGLVTVTYTVGNSPPGAPTAQEPAAGGVTASITPYLIMNAVDSSGDAVKYKALIYSTTANSGGNCSGSLLETGDQTSSGTGWDNGTTAYASNAYATYTIQTALTRGSGYCWQAQAIDPGGSNTFGSLSAASTFTVSNGPLTAGFETGNNGASLSTLDSGNATAFDTFSCDAGDTLAYSNTVVKTGSLSAKLTHTSNLNSCAWSWSTALGAQNDYYMRAYYYITSAPTAISSLFYGKQSTGIKWSVNLDSTSHINFEDTFGDILATSTNTIPTGQWVRIESHVVQGPNASMTIRIFLSPDSTTPTETVSTGNIGGAVGNYSDSFVVGENGGDPTTLYMDSIAAGADNWLGPVNSAPSAPTLSAPSSGATGVSATPSFTLSATDPDGDALKYRLYLYQSDCSTAVGSSPFAQSSSGTGWDNGTTAYGSGTTATYTYQGSLSAGATYCWKADAIDPTGSNTYSSASSTRLFTTAGASSGAVIQGGVDIRGGSTIQ